MKAGKSTVILDCDVSISAYASAVGKKEGETPFADLFDYVDVDDMFGQENFELGESAMQGIALQTLFEKRDLPTNEFELLLGGDLTNQCIATSYAVKDYSVPYFGVYSACSTLTQSLSLAAMLVGSDALKRIACVASSHFCTAERQYRYPLEYGVVRSPTSQRTATACGAFAIEKGNIPPYIRGVTLGKIEDKGVTDSNNMGAAMAYAAYSTLSRFFEDTGKRPCDFDKIITGDLGCVGTDILYELMKADGTDISGNHLDCGKTMYQTMNDVNAGGSGAGCCAAVMASLILPKIKAGEYKNILFAATGALLSVTSVQQKRSIPCVSHLVWLSAEGGK